MIRTYNITLFFLLIFLSGNIVVAQDKKDKPRNGEGVQLFLERNKCSYPKDYDKFIELNKGKFGRNNSLLMGVRYTLPSSSDADKENNDTEKKDNKITQQTTKGKKIGIKGINKLFGSKYQEYTVKSNKLKGACFFLSSGHGGPDPGAIGKVDGRELHEDEYAYDIILRLARNLLEEGATVHIIIQDPNDGIRDEMYLSNSKNETCLGEAIPLNQVARLRQRSDKINELSKKAKEKYKRSMFIHLDSRSKKEQLDVFFYHATKSTAGKKLANTMRQTFESHYNKHQPNRGFTGTVDSRGLYVLNNTNPVGLFGELGNIQNTFDQRRFLQYDNRQALANWLCRGFIQDYENWKKGI